MFKTTVLLMGAALAASNHIFDLNPNQEDLHPELKHRLCSLKSLGSKNVDEFVDLMEDITVPPEERSHVQPEFNALKENYSSWWNDNCLDDTVAEVFKDISGDSQGTPIWRSLNYTTEISQGCNWWAAAMMWFKTGGEYGNWCGKGHPSHCTKYKRPEIQEGWQGSLVCDDRGMDTACSKHDAAADSWDIWGFATINACEVDRQFKIDRLRSGSDDFWDGEGTADHALKAANCLFDTLPCKRWEHYTYWGWCSKWWGGYPCRREVTGWRTVWPEGNYLRGGCRGSCYV